MMTLTAAPDSIGVVRSSGEFRIDGSSIHGNSNIFEGSTIESSSARSEIQLSDGARLTLTPDSRIKIYRDHAVLEQGEGVLRNAEKSAIQAGVVQIFAASRQSVVQIAMNGNRVAVGATGAAAEVRNNSGLLVGRVLPGEALAFEPAPQAGAPVKVTGVLEMRNGKFYLTDPTTHITVELMGQNLASFVGKRVDVTGTLVPGATPTGGATEVANVTSITLAGGNRAVGAGIGGSAEKLIIGGVVVGGVLIGLAAAGTFSSSSASPH